MTTRIFSPFILHSYKAKCTNKINICIYDCHSHSAHMYGTSNIEPVFIIMYNLSGALIEDSDQNARQRSDRSLI